MITTTTEVKEVHQIFDGPSREKLFDALRLAHDDDAGRPTVEFTVEDGTLTGADTACASAWVCRKILFKVIGLEHEDGTGRKFNFEGFLVPPMGKKVDPGHIKLVIGYFDTNTRKGTISAPAGVLREFGF